MCVQSMYSNGAMDRTMFMHHAPCVMVMTYGRESWLWVMNHSCKLVHDLLDKFNAIWIWARIATDWRVAIARREKFRWPEKRMNSCVQPLQSCVQFCLAWKHSPCTPSKTHPFVHCDSDVQLPENGFLKTWMHGMRFDHGPWQNWALSEWNYGFFDKYLFIINMARRTEPKQTWPGETIRSKPFIVWSHACRSHISVGSFLGITAVHFAGKSELFASRFHPRWAKLGRAKPGRGNPGPATGHNPQAFPGFKTRTWSK